jgi:hypothetical protein
LTCDEAFLACREMIAERHFETYVVNLVSTCPKRAMLIWHHAGTTDFTIGMFPIGISIGRREAACSICPFLFCSIIFPKTFNVVLVTFTYRVGIEKQTGLIPPVGAGFRIKKTVYRQADFITAHVRL